MLFNLFMLFVLFMLFIFIYTIDAIDDIDAINTIYSIDIIYLCSIFGLLLNYPFLVLGHSTFRLYDPCTILDLIFMTIEDFIAECINNILMRTNLL